MGAPTINEIFAGRDVLMYTEPWASGNTFPSDTTWGTSPGGSWSAMGYTKDGVAVRWRQQIQTYMVDQSLDPVTALPLSRDLRFVSSIGQIDMPTIVVATSSGTASGVAAPGSGTADFILQSVAQNLYYSVFFDVRNPLTNDFGHFVGWFCRGVGDLEIRVHLPDIAQVNVEMQAFPDTSTTPARVAQFRIQMG
jgi:hypothetical protein